MYHIIEISISHKKGKKKQNLGLSKLGPVARPKTQAPEIWGKSETRNLKTTSRLRAKKREDFKISWSRGKIFKRARNGR